MDLNVIKQFLQNLKIYSVEMLSTSVEGGVQLFSNQQWVKSCSETD